MDEPRWIPNRTILPRARARFHDGDTPRLEPDGCPWCGEDEDDCECVICDQCGGVIVDGACRDCGILEGAPR